MSARLVPLSGAAPVIQLRRPVQLVGRHPECDLRIENMKVSRRHCCLALVYERVVIRDLGSRNGVQVNGVVVDEATLVPWGRGYDRASRLYSDAEGAAEPAPVPPPPPQKSRRLPPPPPQQQAAPTPISLPEIDPDSNETDGDLVPLLDI